MKAKDLAENASVGTTSSGSVAVSNVAVGQPQRRRKRLSRNPSVYGGPTPDNVLFAEDSTNPKYKNKQVKGSDSTPSKSKPTTGHETPHPLRGKLVGDSLELKQRSNKLIQEVMNILDEKVGTNSSAGEYVKDFRKSKAPQFKNKSKKKKHKMAIAAYCGAKEGNC